MRGRRNAAEFKPLLQKMPPGSLDEVLLHVQSKCCTRGLASIRRLQKGCH
jgi:hypothetical protein